MVENTLGPKDSREDVRRYVVEHPNGVIINPSNFLEIALNRRWSSLISDETVFALQAGGLVRIVADKINTKAFPVPPIEKQNV
jgi:hypothetical protein